MMKPEEIARYIRTEFTPLVSMDEDQANAHVADLIQQYAEDFARKEIKSFQEGMLKAIEQHQHKDPLI